LLEREDPEGGRLKGRNIYDFADKGERKKVKLSITGDTKT